MHRESEPEWIHSHFFDEFVIFQLLNGAEFGYRDIESVYSQAGGVVMATVVGCRQLTNEGALRKTIELEFQVQVRQLKDNTYM